MRALATRLRSTLRTPWKALKKTTKNTSTAASITFEGSPRPSHMMKIEPSTMRGSALSGLDVRAEDIGQEADLAEQHADDDTDDDAEEKPSTASSIVIQICSQSEP